MDRIISRTQRIRFAMALSIMLATPAAVALAHDASGSTGNAAAATPKGLAFPDKVFGVSGERSWPKRLKISVSEKSGRPARIKSISIGGANAADFAVHQHGNCIGAPLAAGCAVTVTFTPTGLGTRTATLTVTDNSGGTAESVELSGRGIKASIKWEPREISFGKVRPGAPSAAKPVSITNPNAVPLSITSISVDSSDFVATKTQTCLGQLAAHSSCRFFVAAHPPSAAGKPGKDSIKAKLEIQDDAAGNPHRVMLSALLSGSTVPPPPPVPAALTHAILVTNPPCNNVTSYPIAATGNAIPTFPQPLLCNPTGIAVDASKNIYVTNTGDDKNPSYSVAVYSAGSTGQVGPSSVISGAATLLDIPRGIALDTNNNIYVVNDGSNNGDEDSVTVYPMSSSGNAAPSIVISGSNTGLNLPAGIAVDSHGKIYVANSANNTVTVYPAGLTGTVNQAPIATISGFNTELADPVGVAIDTNGLIYVLDDSEFFGSSSFPPSVNVYPAGSSGNVSPSKMIFGSNTGLSDPTGVALDSSNNIYVVDSGTVLEFSAGSNGNATPIHTILATTTALDGPGIAVDTAANIYVADGAQNDNAGTVTVYPAGSTGSATPSAVINGATNGTMAEPSGIALDKAANIFVTNLNIGSSIEPVEVYAAGSGTIGTDIGSISNADSARGIALDSGQSDGDSSSAGQNVYLSISKPSEVEIFSPLADDFTPIGILHGDLTMLSFPAGIALDATGNIYVTNDADDLNGDRVTIYPAQSTGNMTPSAVIVGSNTGLAFPAGIAVDSAGNIYVANAATDAITEFPPGLTGTVNPTPSNTISGPNTGLNTPYGIAIDSSGLIYVTNEGGYEGNNVSVTVYASGATGNAAPLTTIAGSLTQLARPMGVAVIP